MEPRQRGQKKRQIRRLVSKDRLYPTGQDYGYLPRWITSAIYLGNAGPRGLFQHFRPAGQFLGLDPALEAALLAEGPKARIKACGMQQSVAPTMDSKPIVRRKPVQRRHTARPSAGIYAKSGG